MPNKVLAYCLQDHVQPCQTANIKETGKCGLEYTKNSGKEMNLSRKLEILVIIINFCAQISE